MQPKRSLCLALCGSVFALNAAAQTTISQAWVRATVAQQMASGAFMQITSRQGGKVVGVSSSAAGVAEIHEMTMDGTTMRMRAVPALELPAGKPVELKPGGYHIMLMDLKAPLKAGTHVPLALTIESPDGTRTTLKVDAPVRALGDAPHSH